MFFIHQRLVPFPMNVNQRYRAPLLKMYRKIPSFYTWIMITLYWSGTRNLNLNVYKSSMYVKSIRIQCYFINCWYDHYHDLQRLNCKRRAVLPDIVLYNSGILPRVENVKSGQLRDIYLLNESLQCSISGGGGARQWGCVD